MNYITLIKTILDTSINEKGIKTVGEGDIFEINNKPDVEYPIFWTSATEPQVEHENYFEYVLTFYYVDRLTSNANRIKDTEVAGVHSAGIQIISNIIKKLRQDPRLIDVDTEVRYTLWNDTTVFADVCNGVYTTVHIKAPKETNCIEY